MSSKRGGLRRSLQKCGKPFAAADVPSLRSRTELARVHIFNHALTQRADGIRGHRQLLSEVDEPVDPQDKTPLSLPMILSSGDNARGSGAVQQAIAQAI